ncbi:MAG: type I restriction enzyme HsdR N-terminal domain-containing protein [Saprospiraceae bacterium]|nr:type I restriction enzyme HsdR N-terminal domain-containing protein [Saprospiraceae bacterium]
MSTTIELNLLGFQPHLNLKKQEGKVFIYDQIRKKFLVQTPEEVVRQLFLSYLLLEKKLSQNRIRTEKMLKVNELTKRCDILVFDWDMQPYLLVECKSPNVSLTEATLRQVASYNLPLRVKYLVLTNGMTSYCCELDYEGGQWQFLESIPTFPTQLSK